jgi:hypothetical protein
MKAFLLILVGSAIVYIWIENDPETGGALLLILLLAMLAAWRPATLTGG